MVRPVKPRFVRGPPWIDYFKPRRIPLSSLSEIVLKVEELEAIRLKDLEDLDQEECAKKMKISRGTFQRILNSAKKKIADALVNGKAIKIEGGNYKMPIKKFKCYECGHEWTLPYGTGRPEKCPKCGSTNLHRAPEDRGYARRGRGPRF